MTDFVDPFNVAANDERPRVTLGAVEIGRALRGGTVRDALDEVPQADLALDPGEFSADIPDYFAPLALQSGRGRKREVFRGQVSEAHVADDRIEITARGANALTEQLAGPFAATLDAHEIAYTMARSAGLTPGQISIPELDERPVEVFEVLAPVDGVASSRRRNLGSVVFLPRDAGDEHLAAFGLLKELDVPPEPSAWAVTYETARFGYDAEQAGLDAIDQCLAWLIARGRYGLALLPDGAPQQFFREHGRAFPRRLGLVAIRGQLTGRCWIRSSDMEAAAAHFDLDPEDPLLALGVGNLPLVQRGAITSCARAAAHSDPLTRLQALWEAVEYLVAGVRAARIFENADIKRVRDAVPDDLPETLVQRVHKVLDGITNPPLMARLRTLIDEHALPCSETEFAALIELRQTRNKAAHGHEPTPPEPEQLDQATAVVSRLVVARLAAGWA